MGLAPLVPNVRFCEREDWESWLVKLCIETYGITLARAKKSPPFSGMFSTRSELMVLPISELAVVISSAPAADTVTDWLASPTWSTKSTWALSVTSATRLVTSARLNPGCVTTTLYVPGFSDGNA